MAAPLFLLAVVTIATIVHNFASDFVWDKFDTEAVEKTFSSHIFWHAFSYIFPLLPLCFYLIGKGLDASSAMTFLTTILILLMALLSSGLSASSMSFLLKSNQRQRIDGEWHSSIADSTSKTSLRNGWIHNVVGIFITFLWWFTLYRFYRN
ncbi:MAG: hypothetical protein HOE69_02655 [Euryarchaeota archaeon]|nr:hypothetical protein [Euryarchaeota archaeon]